MSGFTRWLRCAIRGGHDWRQGVRGPLIVEVCVRPWCRGVTWRHIVREDGTRHG